MDSLSSDSFWADEEVAGSQRTKSRDSLFLMARLSLDGGASHDVRIRNLSEGGLMADFDQVVTVGVLARLHIRGIGDVDGHVAWHAAGRVGIALDAKIDPKKARKPVGGGKRTLVYAKSDMR